MAKAITLTIDGKIVRVPDGMLIVDAARTSGIDIPVFCYHPKMEPVGMCRMCLVEVGRPMLDRDTRQPVLEADGSVKIQYGPKLETACTTPVSEGMVVNGFTDKVKEARKDVLELLLTSHPLDCPVCDKGGECPLQNLTMGFGPGESRYDYSDKKHFAKHVPLGDLIYLDRERCIQCARCVRFQEDLVDDPVIGFYQRGRALEIVTCSEPGFDSIFSGNTTDICPVGALTTADFRFGARPWEMKSAASICTHCAVGCNLTYNTRREQKANGKVVIKRAMPRQNEQVNETWLCDKGRFGYHFMESDERITQPMVRQNGKLEPVSWDEALDLAAEKLRTFNFNLTTLVGGRLSNEDFYALKELTDLLHGKKVLFGNMAGGDIVSKIGVGQGTNLGDLGKGSVIFVISSDLHEEAPIWWMRVLAAVKRGASLITVNAHKTRLEKFAQVQIRSEYGQESIIIQQMTPDSSIASSSYQAVHSMVRDAENLVIFYGSDGASLSSSKALVTACANLLIASGHTGRENNGLIPVWQKANDQGAWDNGYRPADDCSQSISHAGVLYIAGADPAGENQILREAVDHANFVIVQELFLTETAKLADIVLPVLANSEREGTYTNGERRVQRFYPVVPPIAGPRADFEIATEIRMRVARMNLETGSASLMFLAMAAHLPDYDGLSYQKLSNIEDQYPILGRSDVYYGGTSYENSQGLGVQLQPSSQRGERVALFENPVNQPTLDRVMLYPVTNLYDDGNTLSYSKLLVNRVPERYVCVSTVTGEQLNVHSGDRIKIEVNNQIIEVVVKIDDSISEKTILAPRSMGITMCEPVPVKILIAETERMRGK